jgi:hypothetical protein
MILFLWLRATPILHNHETSCVRKIISLSFHVYKEHPNWRSYIPCALIWSQGGPRLRIGNKCEVNKHDLNKLEINKDIRLRKYTSLKDLSSVYRERELSHVCGYTWELDLTFYKNEILHFYGYWKMILFLRLWEIPILVDHETGWAENIISLSFHAYKEHPNQRLYVSCALIWT